ncbi:MAG: hypothetical protein HZB82_05780 [Deltaproteobacteria bacterium]|nr:hypothetical protein [Deltaproteobacteria bacterium]
MGTIKKERWPMDLFKAVIADCIGHDIDACLKNNAPTGAILLTYCAIDAMSFLSMPLEQDEVNKNDFITWVNKYMKTDSTQPYGLNPWNETLEYGTLGTERRCPSDKETSGTASSGI